MFEFTVQTGHHVLETGIGRADFFEQDERSTPVQRLVYLIDQCLPVPFLDKLGRVISNDHVGLIEAAGQYVLAVEFHIIQAGADFQRLVDHVLLFIQPYPAYIGFMLVIRCQFFQQMAG